MTREEFAAVQREGASNDLSSLFRICMRRFLKAAELVNVRGPIVVAIRHAEHFSRIDFASLIPAWKRICDWYLRKQFDSQYQLFQDHREYAIEQWNQFVHRELFPALVQDDEFVRNILRVSGLIPSSSKEEAASAIYHQFREMCQLYGTPFWESVDIE